jgi:hypothetical protein
MEFAFGAQVEVTFAGGRRGLCRVVQARGRVVYITSERLYQEARLSGKQPAPLIGVPSRDVALV